MFAMNGLKAKWVVIVVTFGGFLMGGSNVWSAKIELPEEELARETVLPKFDTVESVKNRLIVTEKKIEVAPYVGWNNTEPIYNQSKIGLNLGYHWSELSAISLNAAIWGGGRNTQYTDALAAAPLNLDFGRAPNLIGSYYLHYEMKSYYGKLSLTKRGVLNMSMYPLFGVGITQYESKSYPGLDGGVGLKFYFSRYFALRIDMKIQFSQALDPFLKGYMKKTDTKPDKSQFQDKWTISTIMDVGASFIF